MKNNFKHLYIHIPFCKYICTYCDFVRKIPKNNAEINQYIDLLINEINQIKHKLNSIYIGGGTPNFLNEIQLKKLLNSLQKNIKKTEFTIECNPDFINENQVIIFKKFHINRISLGVQTVNENILKLINRQHNLKICQNAIDLLYKNKITNISIDLIYNLPLLKNNDIKQAINFCASNKIKHVSFYALEIKTNSILSQQKYNLNLEKESDQLEYIIQEFQKNNYQRYEISNWVTNKKYVSQHNLAYWKMKQWKGIGFGSYGFENNNHYCIEGNYLNWKIKNNFLTKQEYYFYILMMGLRLTDGIDLNIQKNNKAFTYYKNKLNFSLLKIENNKLKAKNIDLLHDILVDIV